jgi:hypothetical protein
MGCTAASQFSQLDTTMDQNSIFAATLGLSAPWQITAIKINREEQRLDISVNYNAEHLPHCPICGLQASSCSIRNETWHHSDFFQFAAFLHTRVPVVECTRGCGSCALTPPWDRSDSRFIRLDEESDCS